MLETMGWISIVPVALAVILAFVTRNTIVSLATACVLGCFMAGKGVFGFTDLLKTSLGNADFIWVVTINMMVAVMAAYFEKSGAIEGFTAIVDKKKFKRKSIQLITWLLGCFIFFSDSFSPLFVGGVMRKLSDKAKISREKLAYICDSTSAPVAVFLPITSWSAYLCGLTIGIGAIATQSDAFNLFVKAMPFNFYAVFSIFFVGLICAGIIPEYGPMKKAELRAQKEGKLLRDGAVPLMSAELTDMKVSTKVKPRVFLNFVLPILIFLGVSFGTFAVLGSTKVMEAAVIVVLFMSVSLLIQGMSMQEISDTFMLGIKGAMPAIVILALAYPLNTLSKEMGTANFIINCTKSFLTPALLPFVIFVVSAVMAFATGSSWGTFAICLPIALPLAFNATGNEVTALVAACFAAVAGGGVFGDHCSPVSDTTILSSMGAASDHIDHVKTQLPYALTVAVICAVCYLVIGMIFA